jgi:acyl dehydratase
LVSDVVGIRHVKRFGGRFKAQVWPGDTLTVHMEITGVTDDDRGGTGIELSLSTRNQDEVEVFAATASAYLDDSAKEHAT